MTISSKITLVVTNVKYVFSTEIAFITESKRKRNQLKWDEFWKFNLTMQNISIFVFNRCFRTCSGQNCGFPCSFWGQSNQNVESYLPKKMFSVPTFFNGFLNVLFIKAFNNNTYFSRNFYVCNNLQNN